MDREQIQRRDFPLGRRGYDPATVDEHLRRVADDFEAQVQRPGLSQGASDQVRRILEAAESSAAELRATAGEEAQDHVARVRQATDGMLSRLDDLGRELNGLLEALRTAGERLNAGLAELQHEVGGDVTPAPVPAPPSRAPTPQLPPERTSDDAGARLIALNMALSGVTREETARYLDAHFTLTDADALLDDVYAKLT